MKINLSGKTVLMTGALGGIAEYVVQALTGAGATVIATDKQPTASIQPYYQMDVTDANAVDRVVAAAQQFVARSRYAAARRVLETIIARASASAAVRPPSPEPMTIAS